MKDQFLRTIDYLRISVTDRCDLRCVYCMPEGGVAPLCHNEVLRYEEIYRLARIFASLGIRKIRLTGGEPLVRRDLPKLVAAMKSIEGIETLALTTNGMLLKDALPTLVAAGLTAVNISIDTLNEETFFKITRRHGVDRVLASIDAAVHTPGLTVKLNCVPTECNRADLAALSRFAASRGVPLRFIELMPLGEGKTVQGLREDAVKALLDPAVRGFIPMEAGSDEQCRRFFTGNGGEIGFISALSHKFCNSCNRVRLTADGLLKTCLQYGAGLDLKTLLKESDDEIRSAIESEIWHKPACHHFGEAAPGDETRRMSQIGG